MKTNRISLPKLFSEVAQLISQRATCNRAKVGAVLVKENRIIAIGYNGSPAGMVHCSDVGCKVVNNHCMRTLHAEASLIAYCAKNNINTNNTTLFITLKPCYNCLKLLVAAGVGQIYYDKEQKQEKELDSLYQSLVREADVVMEKIEDIILEKNIMYKYNTKKD